MVTETETLTSTLHHNKFTDLDYVFSVTFIYIYIYMCVCVYVCATYVDKEKNLVLETKIYFN